MKESLADVVKNFAKKLLIAILRYIWELDRFARALLGNGIIEKCKNSGGA